MTNDLTTISAGDGILMHTTLASYLNPDIALYSKNMKPLMIINENSIKFYKDNGEEIIIDDNKDLTFAMENMLRDHFNLDFEEYHRRKRKEMFDEIMSMLGEKNERTLKLETLFNEKNRH